MHGFLFPVKVFFECIQLLLKFPWVNLLPTSWDNPGL